MNPRSRHGRAERDERSSGGRSERPASDLRRAPQGGRYSPSSNRDMSNGTSTRAHKAVYTIVDGKDDKSFWRQLGVAFVNRDGSINILLDALPVNGKLQIRDAEPQARAAEGSHDEEIPDSEH
jgi:hypothetical protein